MKILVTGAGGFLGSHVVRHLLNATTDQVVAVTSRGAEALFEKLGVEKQHEKARVKVVATDELLRTDTLQECQAVINCGFPWNRGGKALAKGLDFQTELFKSSAAARIETFVNVSSQSVYDKHRTGPATEDSPIDCDSPYATAKYALELMAEAALPPEVLVNARASNLIGPGYDVRLLNRFVDAVLGGSTIHVHAADHVFDLMDVRDAASALVFLAREGRSRAPVVNVGSGSGYSLQEIAEVVGSVARDLGMSPRIEKRRSSTQEETIDTRVSNERLLEIMENADFLPLERSAGNIFKAKLTERPWDESGEERSRRLPFPTERLGPVREGEQ